jgi:hypothetical protein
MIGQPGFLTSASRTTRSGPAWRAEASTARESRASTSSGSSAIARRIVRSAAGQSQS